ncbi:LuxR C-terminal-related transcriptional regulator (plasmid) [Rhizobium leguminosarum]|jgi:LuxR family maltose regulon positive regulatory protein
MRDNVTDNVIAQERFGAVAAPWNVSRLSVSQIEPPTPITTSFGIAQRRESLAASSASGGVFEETELPLWRCKTRQSLTGASVPHLRRRLAQVLRLLVAMQVNEALAEIERLEVQLGDLPPAMAKRFRTAIRLFRTAACVLRDDSLAALEIAMSHLKESGTYEQNYFAATLSRLAFWQHGMFDFYDSLAKRQALVRGPRSRAISAMLDVSIEAAIALSQLQLATAKRLASDAASMGEGALKGAGGLASLPACLTAEILYEEGYLDQADAMLHDRLPIIKAEGTIESAVRAYVILARIARQRMQQDVAVLLLREGEILGERRGWPRLVAACICERVHLLLEAGLMTEACRAFESLERQAETHGCAYSRPQVMTYRTLTRLRLSWAEGPSSEAVASLRQLYHESLEQRDYYGGCRLAVELLQMLASIGETEEADTLFFRALKAGADGGLHQTFLDGGAGLNMLLKRAYRRAEMAWTPGREMLPFLGSLLSAWNARKSTDQSYQPSSRVGEALSKRERDIVAMIGQGFSNKLIARTLQISPETVKSHVKRIFAKLSVSTRSEAVCRAGSLGLL